MRRRLTLTLIGAAFTPCAAAQGALFPPPEPTENPVTFEKAILGKFLFWDEQLSSDGSMACGTCHRPAVGGVDPRVDEVALHPGPDGTFGTPDDLFGSPGVRRTNAFGHYVRDGKFAYDAQVTRRNTPSMIGAAYFTGLFWDGRAGDEFRDPLTNAVVIQHGGALETQSLGPILSDIEMAWEGETWASVRERLERVVPLALASDIPPDMLSVRTLSPDYPALFLSAFGTPEITPVRIAFALASYQRTLVPDEAKFDRVMRGQAVFTNREQLGFDVFVSTGARCIVCHAGSLFANDQFHNLGLRPIAEDAGRHAITGDPFDRGTFKTPSLRNVGLRKRFFHTGAPGLDDLLDVVEFYDTGGGPFTDNKDMLLASLNFSDSLRDELVDFLHTLTDPRVANETFPFDRPKLWSERATANPELLGVGAVAGSNGFVPRITAVTPPKEGNVGFRVGLHDALGGTFAYLHVDLLNVPAGATTMDLRHGLPIAQIVQGVGSGDGSLTWIDADATAPVLVGLSYEAQWWIRDGAAPGAMARSDRIRVTIE